MDESCGILTHGVVLVTFTAVLAGCGGSGGSGGSGSSTISSAVSGNGSGTATTVFQQPQEGGIAGNLVVPLATHISPPTGVFGLVLWQVDPNTPNGQLVPTGWNAGSQTGFTPSAPLSAQLGFQNETGTSTAQMEGDVVGAYLNSQDLPSATAGQKMMITPQYTWASGTEPVPFPNSNSVLSSSMDLQVPVAVGNDTYVVADFLFKDPNGVRISYGIKLFGNGIMNPMVGAAYDAPSNSYLLDSPLGFDERFVSIASGSASEAGVPWLGWQHFEWSISQSQFAAGLQYLVAQFPGQVQVTDPAQYVLAEVHLNAEFHYQPAPAQLGWSMRGWAVSITD